MDVKAGHAHNGAMKIILAVILAIAPSLARAETITLRPEQAEHAKEVGAARNAQDAALGVEPGRDKSVHGEMGVAIGTGGYRSIYGTAIVPLSESATLGLSFEREQFNDRYGRYRRGY